YRKLVSVSCRSIHHDSKIGRLVRADHGLMWQVRYSGTICRFGFVDWFYYPSFQLLLESLVVFLYDVGLVVVCPVYGLESFPGKAAVRRGPGLLNIHFPWQV